MNTNVETTATPPVQTQQTRARARARARANKFQPTGHRSPKGKSKTYPQKISKQDLIIAMLRRTEGGTVAAIIKATGWQKHSAHGFFAGVVRKKLKLNLVRSGEREQTTYRIAADKAQSPTVRSAKRGTAQKTAKRARAAKRSS